jgi:hypothetical protein
MSSLAESPMRHAGQKRLTLNRAAATEQRNDFLDRQVGTRDARAAASGFRRRPEFIRYSSLGERRPKGDPSMLRPFAHWSSPRQSPTLICRTVTEKGAKL